jgi:YidC/Oxa1 family membrane protein insertase
VNPFTALVNLLGSILAFFYSLVPNYGVAIILLTVMVSLLLFPLTLKQTRSMKALQVIQPEVKRLQKEHKGDRDEMQKQLMALYQEHGVNPAAGCLPLILQMPIWFALFQVLRVNVDADGELSSTAIPADSELADAIRAHDTNFLGMDLLTAPSEAASSGLRNAIPYILLVLLVVVAGMYQQYQMTRRSTPEQRAQQPQGMQTVLKIMPLFFGFISWTFPSGLVLYFAVSNLFRIGQQAVIFGLDGDGTKPKAAKSEAGDKGTPVTKDKGRSEPPALPEADAAPAATPPPVRKPAPNSSKKRKKRRRN